VEAAAEEGEAERSTLGEKPSAEDARRSNERTFIVG
jgi:hypothetical protein